MSELDEGAGAAQDPSGDAGVLGRLPRTRPQRLSPRRAAARKSSAPAAGATAGTANGAAPGTAASATAPRVRSGQRAARKAKPSARGGTGARARSARVLEEIPPQGYECEDDAARGAVRPPGGLELVASAVELVGEFAKSGISTGERLVKDALSRLPLS